VICPWGEYVHLNCGDESECQREDKHHHHQTPRGVEVISPGTGDECRSTFMEEQA
jgi:hypothetical protein